MDSSKWNTRSSNKFKERLFISKRRNNSTKRTKSYNITSSKKSRTRIRTRNSKPKTNTTKRCRTRCNATRKRTIKEIYERIKTKCRRFNENC